MPLPENGAAWPPTTWAPYYDAMRIDDAWYSGDRKRLARVYTNHPRPTERRRLWGRKSFAHRTDRRDHRLHALPAIVSASGIPESLPWVAGALAVAGGLARVMALPAVEQLLDRVSLGLVDDETGGSA